MNENRPVTDVTLLGIVNATPDSFSDGGAYDPLSHALKLIDEGADGIDIGGESTRPGAMVLSLEEESNRVLPVISALRAVYSGPISIDTQKPELAIRAYEAGATIWNDVNGLRSEGAFEVFRKIKADVIIMHMQNDPATMQNAPYYKDVIGEVEEFLLTQAHKAMQYGLTKDQIILDPGLGFGKTLDNNLALLRAIPRLKKNGFRLLIGASNKSMIAHCEAMAGHKPSLPDQRLAGSLMIHLKAAELGADIVRVHNVAAHRQAFLMASRLN